MRKLEILADGTPFGAECRFHLSGRLRAGLFPSLFLLECFNLSDPEETRLRNTKALFVLREGSCLASGQVTDVFRRTVPEGTVTTAAFSPGLALWEAEVSLSLPAGLSVSETVRRLLEASGTGIRLLSFPGKDPVFSRGQAFLGRAAECILSALSAASAGAYPVPAGLCILPAESLPATLHLTGKDLADRPAFADGGRIMVLSTTVTGFQPGEEMTLETEGKAYAGRILERLVDADTALGPFRTQLLVQLR